MKHLSILFFYNSSISQNKKRLHAFLLGLTVVTVFGFYIVEKSDPISVPISNTHYGNKDRITLQERDDIGVWSTGAPRPEVGGFGSGQSGVGYYRNDTGWIFTVGNASPASSPVVYKYNVNTNKWALMAPLPFARDRLSCAVLKDSVYAIGGAGTVTTYTNTLFKYDIRANMWVSRANLPVNIGWTGSVGYQDSLIYVGGGIIAVASNTVYLYNAISNTWRSATPLPNVRWGGGFSKSGDTLVYAGGIDDSSSTQNTTYEGVISQADRSVITWTIGAPMPLALYRTAATEWGNKGIILTNGSNSPGFTGESVCYVYSPGSDVWSIQANKINPTFYSFIGSVRLENNIWKLICTAGFNGVTYINDTEVFTDTLPGTVGIDPANTVIPNTYVLSQNYPNPFNPNTVISYQLTVSNYVILKVFNSMGKEVLTLVNQRQNAGSYTVEFNASNYSSGIYFYRIQTEGFTETKSMMFLK